MWKGNHHAILGHWAIKSTYVTWKRVMWYREKRNDYYLDQWVKASMGQIETSPLVHTLNLCWDLGLQIFLSYYAYISFMSNFHTLQFHVTHILSFFLFFMLPYTVIGKFCECLLFDRQDSYFIFSFLSLSKNMWQAMTNVSSYHNVVAQKIISAFPWVLPRLVSFCKGSLLFKVNLNQR